MRAIVEALRCSAWAIWAPGQRCRRRRATQLVSRGGVAIGLRRGHRGGPLPLGQHPRHDLASTPGCRPGILMDVHPGLLLCGDGRLATTCFAAKTRMDNLLTVHT